MAPALTFQEVLETLRREVRELSAPELKALLEGPAPPKLIDVREADEYSAGRLPGALSVPRSHLEMKIEACASRDESLVLYCAGGVRSLLAGRALQQLGYCRVASLAGGYLRWHDLAFPVEKPRTLAPAQRERYRRHLVIPEIGERGQQRLLDAKVLVMGLGGLGSPAALYLAAAGVGTLGLVDSDVVDLSNLQRQVIHTRERAGMPKTQSAEEAIAALNPDVKVVPFQERLTAANALGILAPFDLVVDGGDNFPTRYLLNDACVKLAKPNVHGAIYRFEGQVTTFVPGKGPCYRCLYPEAPPPELAPSCAEAGVLGVLPGIVGLLQANEALKLLLGTGEALIGRLLTFDALTTRFSELKLRRDPSCQVCRDGVQVELTQSVDGCSGGKAVPGGT